MSFILSDLHSEFYEKSRKSIRHCKPYLETIWELSILCPLPYYGKKGEYPINMDFFSLKKSKSDEFEKAIQLIQERQNQFLNNKFRVIFNGIELRRLIQLHTEKETMPKLYFIRFDDIVFDARLKFKGYLFAQIPRAIRPIELNGVQIRLRGVGIGGYDSTFLKYYEQIETIRSKWVSGEIFIYEGLESALNIDRDSFNEHDEHFKKLQSVIHKKLNLVFDEISKIAKERSDKIRDRKDDEIKNRMREIVTKQSKGKFKLSQIDSGENESIVVVDKEKGEIILNTAARPIKKKRPDMIIRVVELAYQIAKHTAETDEERDNLFLRFITDIFSKLI